MRIVDIAICIDNNDPKGIGRIRAVRYSSYTGQLERALDYKAWDDKDLFTASPFLPTNLNYIPEKGQAVKIITYDTEKDTVNLEYIAGPFTTNYDYNGQTHSAMVENTTYGIQAQHGQDIKSVDGIYLNPKSVGAFAEHQDYGLYGKYGSDVIFTENGVHIRGGKLISKPFASANQRTQLLQQPLMSDNTSTLHLKKFPKRIEYVNDEVIEENLQKSHVKYFVEYNITSFDGGASNIEFYVYNTEKEGNNFITSNFELGDVTLGSGSTLINVANVMNKSTTDTSPTLIFTASTIQEMYQTIRLNLYQLHSDGLNYYNPSVYSETNMHPFYFRPTNDCKSRILTSNQLANRNTIFSKIAVSTLIKQGLVYSKTFINAPTTKTKKTQKVIKDDTSTEQTFAAVKSDRIYFVSTDTNEYKKPIDFTKIDKYDPTQVNYIKDIEPNTYALVRGEVLVDVLHSIVDLMESHRHQPTEPLSQLDPNYKKLIDKINTLENDMLNNSIRIN
jgi:hypothetical protein